jgi:hypothetical protein
MWELFRFDPFFLLYLVHLALLVLLAVWCCPPGKKPPRSVLRRPAAKGGKGFSHRTASPGSASRQGSRAESALPPNP